jgi:hypothetical protein
MEMYKKILIAILLCFGGKAIAQPSQYTPMTANGYQMKRVKVDSTLHIPSFCGIPTLRGSTSSMGAIAIDTCNNKLYKYNTEFEWTEVGSSDFIDTIFRRSDSVFAKKNGITLFQFKDSVGGGGPGTTPTLQEVLTAGSTVTSNNLITGTTTTRITQTGSGVKTASLSIDTSQIALVNQSSSTNSSFLWLNASATQLSAKSTTLDQTNFSANGISSLLSFTRIPSTTRSLGVDVSGPFMSSNAGTFYFPLTLGTTGQILKLTSPTQLAWANDSSGGSSIDTTSLSNRIDSKIDSLKRSSDSVYAYKNGQWNFQFKDSVGGGGGSFLPLSGGTLTGNLTGTTATFSSNGSSNTFNINHTSGSGHALEITKGGNGEGLIVNKTSGSGNAVTITGTLNATTIVKNGGTSSQFLKADGSVDATTYISDTTTLQQKKLPAYSIMGNKTNAAANPTAVYYKDTAGTYTGTITFTATTAPSGTTNHSYRWTRIGNQVTLNVSLVYSVAGGSVSQVVITLPSDAPTPAKPAGLTGASNTLYPVTYQLVGNISANPPSATQRAILRSNAANNGFEMVALNTGTTIIAFYFTVQYTAQ